MMRGLIVVIVALMSVIFLKRRLYRHHWTAATLVVIGIVLVGLCPVIFKKEETMVGEEHTAG